MPNDALITQRWVLWVLQVQGLSLVLPGTVFAAAQLIVTLLHWDRFAVGTGPFNIWFASDLLPPPVFAAPWIRQQRRAAPRRASEAPLARWQRSGLIVLGALFTGAALCTHGGLGHLPTAVPRQRWFTLGMGVAFTQAGVAGIVPGLTPLLEALLAAYLGFIVFPWSPPARRVLSVAG